jgi:RNA polymerase sigma-70 factor (ECF subfamily)
MSDSDRRRRFEEQAAPLVDVLYRVALRFAHHPEDAEDLVQDTLLKAYRAFDRFEEGTSLRAWMLRILSNTFCNRYRRRANERRVADLPADDPYHDGVLSDASMRSLRDPEMAMEAPLLSQELERAIDRLPESHRVVLLLVEVEGLPYREAAEAMGTPIGTVMSRLHRARKMLQQDLLRSYRWDEDRAPAAAPANEDEEVAGSGDDEGRVVPLRDARQR